MDKFRWLELQWEAISAAPVPFISLMIATAFLTAKIIRAYFSSEAAGAKAHVAYLTQRLTDVEGEKGALLEKLQAHGEDIPTLMKELAARPRIFIGPEEPKDTKAGDIWVQP